MLLVTHFATARARFASATALFASPYFDRTAVFAKLITCAVTILWSVLVVSAPDGLGSAPPFTPYLREVASDRMWAVMFLLIGVAGLFKLWRRRRPTGLTYFLHGLMMFAWTFLALFLCFTHPRLPLSIAVVSTIAAVSIYALMANRRDHRYPEVE